MVALCGCHPIGGPGQVKPRTGQIRKPCTVLSNAAWVAPCSVLSCENKVSRLRGGLSTESNCYIYLVCSPSAVIKLLALLPERCSVQSTNHCQDKQAIQTLLRSPVGPRLKPPPVLVSGSKNGYSPMPAQSKKKYALK